MHTATGRKLDSSDFTTRLISGGVDESVGFEEEVAEESNGDRPGRAGARLAPRVLADCLPSFLLRMGGVVRGRV